jgi:hypothetical protein
MKFIRLAPGKYQSDDGRFVIHRMTSQQTYRPTETSWALYDGDAQVGIDCDTLKEAKGRAYNLVQSERLPPPKMQQKS